MYNAKIQALESRIRQNVTGPDEIIIEVPSDHGETVYLTDFGISPDTDVCCYPAMTKAINYCRSVGASKLVVPRGRYRFKTELGPKAAYIDLEGLSDFILDGQNSEFLFSQVSTYIRMNDCQKTAVKDLILDWEWKGNPLTSVGKIIRMEETGRYFDCRFPSNSEIPEYMNIKIVGPFDPRSLTPGCHRGLEFRPYRNNHVKAANDNTDKKMDDLVRELSNIIQSMEKIGPNIMRFYAVDPVWCQKNIRIGQIYHFRHYEYDAPGIIFCDSSNFSFKNIIIYSCPGSGMIGCGDIHHFEFDSCKIVRRPGTDRFISSTADCMHIANSQGYFRIENCEFAHAGDDCINIHDNTSMGIEVIGQRTILARRIIKGRNNFHIGDEIELRNSDFSPTQYCSRVTSAEYNELDRTCKLTFEDVLPDALHDNTIIFNKRYQTSNYIIRNNFFHSNRARGILIHGSNGLIEGNKFYRIQGAAIQIEAGAEHRWAEGTGVENLILRENWIESCDVNNWVMAVIYMGVYLPGGRTEYPIFNGIIFESNTVVDCPRLAFFISSCANVLLSKNIIINSNTAISSGNVFGSSQNEAPVYGESYDGSIMTSHARGVVINKNKRIQTLKEFNSGVFLGPSSADIFQCGNIEL